MGLFDIFRRKKETDEQKQIRQEIDREIKEKGYITFTNFIPNSKPKKEFKIRKCKECGRSVKHTCISNRTRTFRDALGNNSSDDGQNVQVQQIWAIANHTYKENRTCRGSNRRYKKQFIK